jgi:hypothetical protein
MKQRILLLPGFGEDAFAFEKVRKYFKEYQLVDVNYRNSLDQLSFSDIDVWKLSKLLVAEYQITKNDILIGHSMGGYFSFVIRELVFCEIVLVASFSNPQKVKRVVYNKWFNLSLAKLGLLHKKFFQNYLLKPYRDKYFEKEMQNVVQNFNTFSTAQLSKMMKLSFGEEVESTLKNPLRIHAKNDRVVSVPDEKYESCNLGHFCMHLEEELVAKIILNWLKK